MALRTVVKTKYSSDVIYSLIRSYWDAAAMPYDEASSASCGAVRGDLQMPSSYCTEVASKRNPSAQNISAGVKI